MSGHGKHQSRASVHTSVHTNLVAGQQPQHGAAPYATNQAGKDAVVRGMPEHDNSHTVRSRVSISSRIRHLFDGKHPVQSSANAIKESSQQTSPIAASPRSLPPQEPVSAPSSYAASRPNASNDQPLNKKDGHHKQSPDQPPKRPATKPKYRRMTRQSLSEYLTKAGYSVSAEKVKRVAFRIVLASFLIVSLGIVAVGAINGAKTIDIIVFMLGLWTVTFIAALLLVMAGIYFFLDYRIYQRTREIEDVFPDFLQLASSNIAAGMPIDRALWYAIRPNFGVLAKEMEDVAKATMTGEDLEVSLLRFTDKYNSQTLRRSVNILIEGMRAGGQMADLLNKIALNIEEMKIMRKEMAANVTTYAIFITFAAVVIAPFLFALGTELLSIIIKISGSLDLSSSSSFSFSAPPESAIENFKIFSVAMLVVTTVFSAAIVSVIQHGRVMEGIKTMPVYAIISIIIYYIGLTALHGVFGSII